MPAWIKKHPIPLLFAALLLAAGVVLWNILRPPEVGVLMSLDPETRILSFSPCSGCAIEDLIIEDLVIEDSDHTELIELVTPPFQYQIDRPGTLRVYVQYRDRWNRGYLAGCVLLVNRFVSHSNHSITVLPWLPGIEGGPFLIPESQPCPLCDVSY